ncbi:MAG TPA: family 2A encapsulin nanocompartment cargo protein cysteine desulfurase [Bryobacteraceae bacterium]|jgi:cysteine desulfurase/selenocysteine lyase|nr:family 2A encapsulin nanocompartment cargo protein cysteine desulfurase [Bryobacteraceae bacterium]
MSTNITSTSNGAGGNGSKSSAPKYPFGAIPLPDPAVIERLANEFFLTMPRDLAEGDYAAEAPPEPEPEEIPVFSFQEATGMGSPPSMPASPPSSPSSPPGPLTESDLRAIAALLGGATALAPGAPATAPSPLVPGSPPYSPGEGKVSPFALAPALPPGAELFSFPGALAAPSSPPTSPPSGADAVAVPPPSAAAVPGSSPYLLEGEKGASPVAAPVLPPINEMFSFPRVPGVPNVPGIKTIPTVPAPPASPSAARPAHDVKGIAPEVPGVPAAEASGISYPGELKLLPSAGEMFSFPGVPGVQSAPGTPAPPSSAPTAEEPGTQAPGIESFEFRPDLEPEEMGIAKRPFDARLIRRDFPILQEQVHGRPLIWLDSAATSQKPNAVIDRLASFYRHENSNVHRAAHTLAARATDAYESAREKVRRFLNASSTREIVFVRGATEGINLVAQAWGRRNVQKDDEIVITWLEHHANIVPWQQLCAEKGACLRVAPVDDTGQVILEQYEKLLSPRTRIVAFTHVSNALGTITPAREMTEMAHRHGALVLIDGAQSVPHMREDVQALDCDFFVFSGHKVLGPMGIGVLYGKSAILDSTPPWQSGGNMIADVTFEKTVYQPSPARFEAGTGNIADAAGLGAALDYLSEIGIENVARHEHELLTYATAGLRTVPGLRIIGTAPDKAGVISFVIDEVRAEDVGVALDQEGIAVRAGHHCAQPILRRFGLESTVRPSLALYNTTDDIDALVAALLRIQAGRGHRTL